jgi:hypothetical protein
VEFRWIPRFEDRYDIAQDGTVRSWTAGSRYGSVKRAEPVIKKPRERDGKLYVFLNDGDQKASFEVARLVALVWGVEEDRWLPIPKYEGRYDASDRGRIRSLVCGGRGGGALPRAMPLILEPKINEDGYEAVGLWNAEGKRHTKLVHRLILETFAGPCPAGCEGSHLDGVRAHNNIRNLVWEPRKANNNRRRGHGTMPQGETSGQAKVTEDDVRELRASVRLVAREWAERKGVTETNAMYILQGKSWRHLD